MSPERSSYEISFEEIISNAKERMLLDGKIEPILVIESSKSLVIVPLQDMPETHGERIGLMRFLGQFTAKSGKVNQLQQVFMVTEGWMSKATKSKPSKMRPSQDPNRKEVLIISGIQMRERKKHLKLFEILRDSNEHVVSLEGFFPNEKQDESVEIPLLEAFVYGFQMAFQTKYN